jgi:hypothetical protein
LDEDELDDVWNIFNWMKNVLHLQKRNGQAANNNKNMKTTTKDMNARAAATSHLLNADIWKSDNMT